MSWYEEEKRRQRGRLLGPLIIVIATLVLLFLGGNLRAQELSTESKAVISYVAEVEMRAIKDGDWDTAYAMLHSDVRKHINVKQFMERVFATTSAMTQAREYRMGDGKLTRLKVIGSVMQEVHFSDRRGVPWVALFWLRQDANLWKVMGVYVLKAAATSV